MAARAIVFVGAALWLGTLGPSSAWAGEPADQLLARIDQVLKTLGDPDLKQPARAQERREAIRRCADDLLDFEELAHRSLAHHWEARTPAEREEFVQLFREFLERVLVNRLDSSHVERVVLVSDVLDGDEATVKTLVAARQGAIPVDYLMLRRSGRWRVRDIVFSGRSLVGNFRAQFDSVIKRASYQQLVKQVRDRQH